MLILMPKLSFGLWFNFSEPLLLLPNPCLHLILDLASCVTAKQSHSGFGASYTYYIIHAVSAFGPTF